jgi:hypothetical protein
MLSIGVAIDDLDKMIVQLLATVRAGSPSKSTCSAHSQP